MSFAATRMDLEMILRREVSQKRQRPYDTTDTWNLKRDTNEFIYKAETDSRTYRTSLWLPKGMAGARGDTLGVWD